MNQQTWSVVFDVAAIVAKFQRLFKGFDPKAWEDWARAVGYNPVALEDIYWDDSKRMAFRAWAMVASLIPHEFLSPEVHWGEKVPVHLDRGLGRRVRRLPDWLLRLKHECLCSFMEALPASPLFDWSDHQVAVRHLPRLNHELLSFLTVPDTWKHKWGQQQRQRAFDCFRLQGYHECPTDHRPKGYFNSFTDLMCYRFEVDDKWKRLAYAKMRPLVESEVRGNPEASGALRSYVEAVHFWIDPGYETWYPTYPEDLAVDQMTLLMDLEGPSWDERIPVEVYGGWTTVLSQAGKNDYLLRLAQHYLLDAVPCPTPTSDHPGLIWYNLVHLAKTALPFIEDEVLKERAKFVIQYEEERSAPRRAKNAALAQANEAASKASAVLNK